MCFGLHRRGLVCNSLEEWMQKSKATVGKRGQDKRDRGTERGGEEIVRGWRILSQSTLQRQNTEISKQIFPEKEYRGLSPNFHIHASVSDLYIPTFGLPPYSAGGNM
jgi:hypothetical protein